MTGEIHETPEVDDEQEIPLEPLPPYANEQTYLRSVSSLPLPTGEQIADFVGFVSGAKSWHLPPRPPGAPIYFYLDENAGRDRLRRWGHEVIYRAGLSVFFLVERTTDLSSIEFSQFALQFGDALVQIIHFRLVPLHLERQNGVLDIQTAQLQVTQEALQRFALHNTPPFKGGKYGAGVRQDESLGPEAMGSGSLAAGEKLPQLDHGLSIQGAVGAQLAIDLRLSGIRGVGRYGFHIRCHGHAAVLHPF